MSLRLTTPNTLILSVAAATIIGRYTQTSYTGLSILTRACVIFLIINAARVVWACYIYPHYRSPLRHLPRPPDKPSIFMGHFWQMMDAGPGTVLRSWANSVPNQGIIRYLDYFNLERLAIVSPAALADVLVHNCYDFEKPPALRKGISRILGNGLFLSEGESHRVSENCPCLAPLTPVLCSNTVFRSKENTLCLRSLTGVSRICTPCFGISREN